MIKQKKIPTLFAIVVLVIGIVAGVFLVQSDKIFQTNASPEATPTQVRITNITDRGFAVSWITDKQSQGFVSYGPSTSLGLVAKQQSDLPNAATNVHHATIESLKANTTYYFKIGSGDQLFDNNGQLYQVKTGPQLSNPPSQDIIFGNIVDATNKPQANATVYITLTGVTPQSVLTDSSGKWSLPLSTSRNITLSSFANYTEDSLIEIFVQGGSGKIATAKTKAKNAHPVPTITLGQNLDFTNVTSLPAGSLPNAKITLPQNTQQTQTSVQTQSTSTTPSVEVILNSPQSNEVLTNTKPIISGTGTPKTAITIKLQGPKTINGSTTINSQGNWSWAVPQTLSVGNYTITLSWKDENKQTKTSTSSFSISKPQAAASNVATGSATSTAVGSPSIATSTATPSPTTTAVSNLTPGSLTPGILLFIMGIVSIIVGIVFPKLKL
jgi:hypothetical protein